MIKTTRVIESTEMDIKISIDADNNNVEFYQAGDDYPLFTTTAKEFLDFIVDCWPENVAYQFKDNE